MPEESSGQPRRALIVTGGDPATDAPPVFPVVIAADSGLDQALALGLHVDVAVGDFDSASPRALAAAERAGTVIQRHPEAKEHTDLELALLVARDLGVEEVLVVGGGGGRLDHLIGHLAVLGSEDFAGMRVCACVDSARVEVIRARTARLRAEVGDLLSLIPVGGPAEGITTSGLQYPLAGETLWPGSTRGLSNVHLDREATVSVTGGVVLAIHPGGTKP